VDGEMTFATPQRRFTSLQCSGARRAGLPSRDSPSTVTHDGSHTRVVVPNEPPDYWDLQAQVAALARQIATHHSEIDALGARADESDRRADASEARLDDSGPRFEDIEARAFVDRDMIFELQRDGVLNREHQAQMEEALKTSRIIGAAIGMLMQDSKVSYETAFAALEAASSRSHRKLREVAEDFVANGPAGHPH
jgi:hypothetical protein